ncbi:FasG-like protein [Escherichia coli]|nr:FasG-like protein [Escherichia coli]CTX07141.1 FasG-like protein [Escherichia coli]CTZ36545.1 FasG-like protein [Escherichia coli]
MIKVNNIFVLLFCLLLSKTTMAEVVNDYSEIRAIFDRTAVPDNWLQLQKLNIGTAETLSSSLNRCLPATFMCTAGSIFLGYNGQANYILYLTREIATITDKAGNSYKFTVAFPDNVPVVGVYEKNTQGGRTWNTTAVLNKKLSLPSDSSEASMARASAQGYCGNVYGCNYIIGSFMHTNSGMPYVYVKLPKNLSARTLYFNDIEVLSLTLYISNKGGDLLSPVSAKLYLSGEIKVPERCFIKVDNQKFDFETVYSNANNGVLKNVSTSIITECNYAPDNTQQYLKVEAYSGGKLNDSSMLYQIASDPALGVVFSINNNPQCNSTTDNRNVFNKEYLIRSITYQPHQTATDIVNFSLCKFGVPSVIGQKAVILKLTSRWVVN